MSKYNEIFNVIKRIFHIQTISKGGCVKYFPVIAFAVIVSVVAGCSDDDKDKNPLGPDSSMKLAVVNTGGDDEFNISVIDYENNTAWNDLLPVSGTSELTQYGDYVYIVDKAADRIVKFDPVNRTATGECSVGSGKAPNSIVFASPDKAYVTLSDAAEIAILNPSDMTVTGAIDISAMADDDGDPDQGHGVIKGDNLYVALRRSDGRSLSDHSSLAVVDIKADTVVTEIILHTNGIAGANMLSLGGCVGGESRVSGDVYPYIIGSVSDPGDGAIERLDLNEMITDVIMGETAIGGNLTTWVFDTPTTGWAIVGLSDASGGDGWGLSRFDLIAGDFTQVSDFQKSYYSWALDYTDDGLVLVGSNDEDNPGVLVLDSRDGYKHVFEQPIDVGLLPKRLVVVR